MFDEAISLFSIWASMNTWLTPTFLFLFLNLMIGTIFITSSFNSPKPNLTNNNNYHDIVHPNHQQQQQQQQQSHSQLTRGPSVLQRLKSINFYSYYSQNLSQASDPFCNPKSEPELKKVQTQTQTQTYTRVERPIKTQTRIQNQTQTQAEDKARNDNRDEPQFKTQTRIQTETRAPTIEEDFTDDEVPTLDEVYNRIKGISSTHHNRQKSDTVPRGGEIPVRLAAKIKKSASHKSAFNHFGEIEAPAAAVVTEEVDARADDFINRFKKQLQLQRIESIVRHKDMISKGSGK